MTSAWFKKLTVEQEHKLLREYDMIPVGSRGVRDRRIVVELARKWGVSTSHVRTLVMRRKAKKGA